MSAKRNTLQQQIILDTILSLDKHPSAEELYFEVQKSYPMVGKSTVYRHLNQLFKEGVIGQLLMDGPVRYDKKTDFHYHFACDSCKSIIDVETNLCDKLDKAVLEKYGLMVNRYQVNLYGICSDCLEPIQQ